MDKKMMNNEFFGSVLASIGDGVIATNTAGKIVFMNPAAETITGWPSEDALGLDVDMVFTLYYAETRKRLASPVLSVLSSGTAGGLQDGTILVTRAGTTSYLSAHCSLVQAVDQVVTGAVVVFRDITRHKRLEQENAEREAYLQTIFHSAPVGMLSMDMDGLICQVNDAAINMLGGDTAAAVGKSFGDAFSCKGCLEDPRGCGYGLSCETCELKRTRLFAAEGLATSGLECCKTFIRNGREHSLWFRISASRTVVNGQLHVLLTLVDITDQKRREFEVIKSRDFYLRIFEGFPTIIWRSDFDHENEYINENWHLLTGQSVEQALGHGWLEMIHPDDRDKMLAAPSMDLTDNDQEEGEIRVLSRSGQYRWLYWVNRTYYAADGTPEGYVGMGFDTTDRKKAEEALQESQTKYRSLFMSMTSSFCYCQMVTNSGGTLQDFIIKEVNSAFEQILDSEAEDVTGLRFSELLPDFSRFLHGVALRSLSDQGTIDVKNAEYYSQGRKRWFSVSAFEAGQGYLGIISTDITARKLAEVEFLKSQAKYRQLFMNMRSAFSYQRIILNKQGKPVDFEYLEVNQAFEDFAGRKRDELIGSRFSEINPEYIEACADRIAQWGGVAVGRIDRHEAEYYSEIAQKWLSVAVYSPKKHYFVTIMTDITARKLAERELTKAKEKAEAASRAKSEFLANMSHEIRTPINGMMGMIELTLMTELNPEQKDNLSIAKSCAASLLRIINDILDFSRLEAGKIVIDNTAFEVRELLEELIRTHSPQASPKGLALDWILSAGVPPTVAGDPGRLRQVLSNLVGNALKFTEQGGVTVTVRETGVSGDDLELTFTVADTGIGIAAEDMDKLFETFSQVDGSITRRFGGAGLGLTISKRLVEMMGGRMWVQSQEGRGSTFFFTVKMKVAKGAPAQPLQKPRQPRASVALHILLAEDNLVSRQLLLRLLKRMGHSVDEADNGEAAVDLYKKNKYDLILMDIQMPVMDGVEATRLIREAEKATGEHISIIAVTAHALSGDRERFLAAGMDEYIAKPLQMDELFQKLEQFSPVAGEKSALDAMGLELTASGEVVLRTTAARQANPDEGAVVDEIESLVGALDGDLANDDSDKIDGKIQKIKELASGVGAEELRNAAFKAQLAARRGNLPEAIRQIEQIAQMINTFRKTRIIS
ncbi:MAG: PAS domain S-box protein [Negativicutes bacterium]|nr:PAS domain S-box protein [Negativicutes bacterium]